MFLELKPLNFNRLFMSYTARFAIYVIFLAITIGSEAMAKSKYGYEDCILDHLDQVKLDTASRYIAEACEENYGSPPGQVSTKERRYNECLLNHMVEVESIDAIIRIRTACEKKYR